MYIWLKSKSIYYIYYHTIGMPAGYNTQENDIIPACSSFMESCPCPFWRPVWRLWRSYCPFILLCTLQGQTVPLSFYVHIKVRLSLYPSLYTSRLDCPFILLCTLQGQTVPLSFFAHFKVRLFLYPSLYTSRSDCPFILLCTLQGFVHCLVSIQESIIIE